MPLTPDQRRAFFRYFTGEEHAYASTLMAILGYLYGAEFLSNPEDGRPWTPASLRLQVIDDTGIDIDDKVMDKIQAAILAITDDRVFNDVVIFHNVATALYDQDVIVDEWDEPDVEELAWAIVEITLLRGEEAKEAQELAEAISDELEKYITVVLRREGFTRTPKYLNFVELPKLGEEDYSDDPTMFDSIFKEQERKITEVEELVDENVDRMLQQLESLPLGKNWFKREHLFGRPKAESA